VEYYGMCAESSQVTQVPVLTNRGSIFRGIRGPLLITRYCYRKSFM